MLNKSKVVFNVLIVLVFQSLILSADLKAQIKVAEDVHGKKITDSISLELLQAPISELEDWNSLKGKVIILDFWATWCAPCIKAIPHMNSLIDDFSNKPVQFISITDEKKVVIERFLKRKTMNGWIGLDRNRLLTESVGIIYYPTLLMIDKKGIVREIIDPEDLTKELINKYLQN